MTLWRQSAFFHPETAASKPLAGCSACLQGQAVRYDGGDKKQKSFEQWINQHLTIEALCPEVAIGLSVPRPPVQLVEKSGRIQALGVEDPSLDVTTPLENEGVRISNKVGKTWPLSGYLFKSRSPSCGIGSTPIITNKNHHQGNGLYAHQLTTQRPWLPVFEEQQLQTEHDCLYALLQIFLCQDIIWVTDDSQWLQLLEHYQGLLQRLHADAPAIDTQQKAASSIETRQQLMQFLIKNLGAALKQKEQQEVLLNLFLAP